MIILEAQLPPALAVWITDTFKNPCFSAQFLNLRHAEDEEIFAFSRKKNAIVITKDDGFISLLNASAVRRKSSGWHPEIHPKTG